MIASWMATSWMTASWMATGIFGSLINNCLIISLSLYPMKYLREFLLPYGSSLETNILLTSMSSILFAFLFL